MIEEINEESLLSKSPISPLIRNWLDNQRSPEFNAHDSLLSLSECIEREQTEFWGRDPDPFDERVPKKIPVAGTYADVCSDLMDHSKFVLDLIVTYITTRSDNSQCTTLTLRFLCSVLNTCSLSNIFEEFDSDTREQFYNKIFDWALAETGPENVYATCIAGHITKSDDQVIPQRKSTYMSLINQTMARLESLNSASNDNMRTNWNIRDQHGTCLDELGGSNTNVRGMSMSQICGVWNLACPMKEATQERLLIFFLRHIAEFETLMPSIYTSGVLPLIASWLRGDRHDDIRLTFEALRLLTKLLCHRVIYIEFYDRLDGVTLLLNIPRPSVAANAVSFCLYNLLYYTEIVDKIIAQHSPSQLEHLINVLLWTVETCHPTARSYGMMCINCLIRQPGPLRIFERLNGPRYILNALAVLPTMCSAGTVGPGGGGVLGDGSGGNHLSSGGTVTGGGIATNTTNSTASNAITPTVVASTVTGLSNGSSAGGTGTTSSITGTGTATLVASGSSNSLSGMGATTTNGNAAPIATTESGTGPSVAANSLKSNPRKDQTYFGLLKTTLNTMKICLEQSLINWALETDNGGIFATGGAGITGSGSTRHATSAMPGLGLGLGVGATGNSGGVIGTGPGTMLPFPSETETPFSKMAVACIPMAMRLQTWRHPYISDRSNIIKIIYSKSCGLFEDTFGVYHDMITSSLDILSLLCISNKFIVKFLDFSESDTKATIKMIFGILMRRPKSVSPNHVKALKSILFFLSILCCRPLNGPGPLTRQPNSASTTTNTTASASATALPITTTTTTKTPRKRRFEEIIDAFPPSATSVDVDPDSVVQKIHVSDQRLLTTVKHVITNNANGNTTSTWNPNRFPSTTNSGFIIPTTTGAGAGTEAANVISSTSTSRNTTQSSTNQRSTALWSSNQISTTPTATTTTVHQELQNKLWNLIRCYNAIPKLLKILEVPLSPLDAVAVRTWVCYVLSGVSRCADILLMLRKLPTFNKGIVENLMKETVTPERQAEHAEFCTIARRLIRDLRGDQSSTSVFPGFAYGYDYGYGYMDADGYNVNGNGPGNNKACGVVVVVGDGSGSDLRPDQMMRRMEIVSRTQIQWDNRELLHLIHDHLQQSGFPDVADHLSRRANLADVYHHQSIQQQQHGQPERVSLYLQDNSPADGTMINGLDNSFSNKSRLGNQNDSMTTDSVCGPPSSSLFQTSLTPIRTNRASCQQSKHVTSSSTPKRSLNTTLSSSQPSSSTTVQSKPKLYRDSVQGTKQSIIMTCGTSGGTSSVTGTGFGTTTPMRPIGAGRGAIFKTGTKPGNTTTLNDIVETFLRTQHAQCPNPISICPKFSLQSKHVCPPVGDRWNRPRGVDNVLGYITRRSLDSTPHSQYNRMLHRYVHRSFKPRVILNESDVFADDRFSDVFCFAKGLEDGLFFAGENCGIVFTDIDLAQASVEIGEVDNTTSNLENTKNGRLLMVSSAFTKRSGSLLTLFNVENRCYDPTRMKKEKEYQYSGYAEFSKTNDTKFIVTQDKVAKVVDVETGNALHTCSSEDTVVRSMRSSINRATFSYDDNLVLSYGTLWDVRCSPRDPVVMDAFMHRFDNLEDIVSGVFHPNGLELIIGSAVWDIRTYRLLQNIQALKSSRIIFNEQGDFFYTYKDSVNSYVSNPVARGQNIFQCFDSRDYSVVATVNTNKVILSLNVDPKDLGVAVIESNDEGGMHAQCRVFSVGFKWSSSSSYDIDDDVAGTEDKEPTESDLEIVMDVDLNDIMYLSDSDYDDEDDDDDDDDENGTLSTDDQAAEGEDDDDDDDENDSFFSLTSSQSGRTSSYDNNEITDMIDSGESEFDVTDSSDYD